VSGIEDTPGRRIRRFLTYINVMRVTVCQIHGRPEDLARDWDDLVKHVQVEASELVLLPEMPFYHWFPVSRQVEDEVWRSAVAAHDEWLGRLPTLTPAIILGTRPAMRDGKRINEGFVWWYPAGCQSRHQKFYLPDEEGYWEATWYERGDGAFTPFEAGEAKIGYQICTDLWFTQHARAFSRKGIHLLAAPRATPAATLDKWIAGGRTAAVISGAFCISSNRISSEDEEADQGGGSWIIDPNGEVLGLTTKEDPFLTLDLDLSEADRAKKSYPRYVAD